MRKIILFLISIYFVSCRLDYVCRDRSGKEVDWYSIFLLPDSASGDGQIYYGYYDPNLSEIQYYKYEERNFPPTKITSYIIDSLEGKNNYFLWNDDKTVKNGDSINAANSKAHAKGSLVYDSRNGAFLLHSLPRYPTRTNDNIILTELPSNGGSYGQTFLCISVTKSTAEKIAEMLNYINVSINKSVEKDRVNNPPNPWIERLITNKMYSNYPKEYQTKIQSKHGETFNFIGKAANNRVIPYDTTLRKIYSDDFYLRTWTRPSLADTNYDYFSLIHVLDVQYGIYQYGKTKEHSKWAISKNKNIVCFSDLNHTESQKDRGGHIICFENKILHSIMMKTIKTIEPKKEEKKDKKSNKFLSSN